MSHNSNMINMKITATSNKSKSHSIAPRCTEKVSQLKASTNKIINPTKRVIQLSRDHIVVEEEREVDIDRIMRSSNMKEAMSIVMIIMEHPREAIIGTIDSTQKTSLRKASKSSHK